MPATEQLYLLPAQNTQSEKIIQYMQQTLKDADFDPVGDPGGQKLFQRVVRGTMSDIDRVWTPGAAVEEGPEKTIQLMWPITDVVFRVFINFKIFHRTGQDHGEVGVDQFSMIRYYVGRIINLFVTSDQWLGGLALDVVPVGNTPEVNGKADTEPGGTVYFDIHYRYEFGDMFTGR